jgi:pimeloyl-ACP methyl ester carboxylesterase
MKSWKQRLDQFVISAAARSLPPPCPDPGQCAEAEELARNAELFIPPEIPADITFSPHGDVFHFKSTVSSPSEKNNLVRGRLFRAGEDWQRRPFLLVVHGWNAELHYRRICPLLARGLNRRGMNAALIQLPFHMERRPGGRHADFICDNIPGMLNATRQAIADFNALLVWAKQQGCPKTALWGFSLGGWLAGLHLCASAAQDAAVLAIAVSNLERAIRDLEFCHPIRAALGVAPIDASRLNLATLKPRIAPERILLVEAIYDMFVPSETFREVAGAWGISEWKKVPQSHISSLFSPRTMREIMDWLARTLLV